MPKAGSQWNTFVITAKGNRMIVEINSEQTVDVEDSKFPSGPFALQSGDGSKDAPVGIIMWRKVQISSM